MGGWEERIFASVDGSSAYLCIIINILCDNIRACIYRCT